MKHKYYRSLTVTAALLAALLCVQAYTGSDRAEELFQEAKILIFDKKWDKAQDILDVLLKEYPGSSLHSPALFYKAKCLKEQDGKETEALKVYRKYLIKDDTNARLLEEAETAIIDLAFLLYEKTERKSYLREIEKRLYQKNRMVKYYAAVTLSRAKDRKYARKAVPVLEEIIESESDVELRDRARIYLLRVDPEAYNEMNRQPKGERSGMLNILVQEWGKKTPEFSLRIPWSLADLALGAIPEEAREELRKEGYSLDKIVKEITQHKGRILEIKLKNSMIKIWIE